MKAFVVLFTALLSAVLLVHLGKLRALLVLQPELLVRSDTIPHLHMTKSDQNEGTIAHFPPDECCWCAADVLQVALPYPASHHVAESSKGRLPWQPSPLQGTFAPNTRLLAAERLFDGLVQGSGQQVLASCIPIVHLDMDYTITYCILQF